MYTQYWFEGEKTMSNQSATQEEHSQTRTVEVFESNFHASTDYTIYGPRTEREARHAAKKAYEKLHGRNPTGIIVKRDGKRAEWRVHVDEVFGTRREEETTVEVHPDPEATPTESDEPVRIPDLPVASQPQREMENEPTETVPPTELEPGDIIYTQATNPQLARVSEVCDDFAIAYTGGGRLVEYRQGTNPITRLTNFDPADYEETGVIDS